MTQPYHPLSCQSCVAYWKTHAAMQELTFCDWLIQRGACVRAALAAGALRGDWTVTASDDRALDARDGNGQNAVVVIERKLDE